MARFYVADTVEDYQLEVQDDKAYEINGLTKDSLVDSNARLRGTFKERMERQLRRLEADPQETVSSTKKVKTMDRKSTAMSPTVDGGAESASSEDLKLENISAAIAAEQELQNEPMALDDHDTSLSCRDPSEAETAESWATAVDEHDNQVTISNDQAPIQTEDQFFLEAQEPAQWEEMDYKIQLEPEVAAVSTPQELEETSVEAPNNDVMLDEKPDTNQSPRCNEAVLGMKDLNEQEAAGEICLA